MANQAPLTLYVGDERPDWVETITVNGARNDYTAATFDLAFVDEDKNVLFTASDWTTGDADGNVTTVWVGAQLISNDVTATAVNPVQRYTCFLTVTLAGSEDLTIERPLIMRWRPT